MKRILIKYCLSLILTLSICIPAIANQKDIRKLEREIKYYDFTLQDVKKIINNDNFSGNLFLNFDDNEKKSGFFILEKKRSYLGFITILTDTSKIYEFCTFSISRAGKADFSKNYFRDAKASAQCQSSNYFKGVVISSKKSGEILELDINGQFKGKIDNKTNFKLKSFTDNNQFNESIKIINQFLEDKKNKTIVKLDQLKQENLEKELAAKKKAEEEKRQKELEAKKRAEEEKRQKELAAKKKDEEEKRQKELAAKKKAEEEKKQKELAAKKRAEEEKKQKELAAKKRAEEKRQKELAAKKAEEEKRQKRLAEEKKIKEEQARAKKKAEQLALNKKILEYKRKALNFYKDIEGFVKSGGDVDLVALSDYYEVKPSPNEKWDNTKLSNYEKLRSFMTSIPQFIEFERKAIAERLKETFALKDKSIAELNNNLKELNGLMRKMFGSSEVPIIKNLIKDIQSVLSDFNQASADKVLIKSADYLSNKVEKPQDDKEKKIKAEQQKNQKNDAILTRQNNQNFSEIPKSLKIIFAGTSSFKEVGMKNPTLKKCVFSYNQLLNNIEIRFVHDLTKIQWKYYRIKSIQSKNIVGFPCDGDCNSFEIPKNIDKDSQNIVKNFLNKQINPKVMILPLMTNEKKLKESVFDFIKICPGSSKKVETEVPPSLKFLFVGDKSYKDFFMSDVKFTNCKLSYTSDILGKYNILVDFNKVNFKSLNYKNIKGVVNYSFSCSGKCFVLVAADKNSKSFANMLNKLSPENELNSPLQSTRIRFEKALNDFTNICPGHISKY